MNEKEIAALALEIGRQCDRKTEELRAVRRELASTELKIVRLFRKAGREEAERFLARKAMRPDLKERLFRRAFGSKA